MEWKTRRTCRKIKEKERTDRLEAARLCGKFRNPVVCRDPKFEKHSSKKAIPLPVWTGPEVSRWLRLPDFETICI
jgi:hypothetical protein